MRFCKHRKFAISREEELVSPHTIQETMVELAETYSSNQDTCAASNADKVDLAKAGDYYAENNCQTYPFCHYYAVALHLDKDSSACRFSLANPVETQNDVKSSRPFSYLPCSVTKGS